MNGYVNWKLQRKPAQERNWKVISEGVQASQGLNILHGFCYKSFEVPRDFPTVKPNTASFFPLHYGSIIWCPHSLVRIKNFILRYYRQVISRCHQWSLEILNKKKKKLHFFSVFLLWFFKFCPNGVVYCILSLVSSLVLQEWFIPSLSCPISVCA